MEAAFVDIGKGRNAVLYAGEVNWDAAGLEGQPKRIEQALKSGDSVLVQVTKDPIGHKGARLTSQISLPGRYLVYVPRRLDDRDQPQAARHRADPAEEDPQEGRPRGRRRHRAHRRRGRQRGGAGPRRGPAAAPSGRTSRPSPTAGASAPTLLYGEPDLAIRVVRDIFNEDFTELVVSGDEAWDTIEAYVGHVAPDLADRLRRWTADEDVFAHYRIDEQLAKALDRKVWLPSGGSLVIDRTEAMIVVDVNTGKFTGQGGNLEETVTKNNLEAAEEIVRQLRLRDIGGIIVIDFIDMVLESNRDLVLRRLVECLGRDRTKHQVAEVTSLGLVQMTRKRIGQGLLEAFSAPCEALQRAWRQGRRWSRSGTAVRAGARPLPHRCRCRCRAARRGRPSAGAGATATAPAERRPRPPAPVPAPRPGGRSAEAPLSRRSSRRPRRRRSRRAAFDLHDGESAYPARRRGRRRATSPAGAPNGRRRGGDRPMRASRLGDASRAG